MKRTFAVVAVLASALAAASLAAAAPGPKPKLPKSELQPKACGKGRLVLNVVQKVENDVDSGIRGNYWASDDYTRTIKVWRVAANRYCAVVRYVGTFTTIAGASPGGTGIVTDGVQGKFTGGYRMDFTATMKTVAEKPRRGSIGTFDYRCTPTGDCPGAVYWASYYFNSISGDEFDWWGWTYTARGQTWVNASTGNSGDIVTKTGPKKD